MSFLSIQHLYASEVARGFDLVIVKSIVIHNICLKV